MLQKILTWNRKQQHMMDNAPDLIAEGIKNMFSEEQIQEILNEVEE